MKKLSLYLLLALIICGKTQIFATNPINVQAHYIADDFKNSSENKGLFAKAKKWVEKKVAVDWSNDKARKMGIASLVLGILSIGAWALLAVTNGWIILFIVVCALAGDILSIMTLWNTRKNKKENRTARGASWFGLVFSLLTGLAPLALFGIILASL